MSGTPLSPPADPVSATVAHQLNNPLTAVIANLEIAMRQLAQLPCTDAERAAIEDRLADAHLAARRLHGMLRELSHAGSVSNANWGAHAGRVLPASRRGRVLIIDDDALIVTALQRTLESDHEVLALNDAEQALQQLRGGARFDLILCDLMLPGVNGMDLHAELLGFAPEQAASMVFLSGGACSGRARRFLLEVPNLHVEKPFDTHSLRQLVNQRVR